VTVADASAVRVGVSVLAGDGGTTGSKGLTSLLISPTRSTRATIAPRVRARSGCAAAAATPVTGYRLLFILNLRLRLDQERRA